MDGKLFQMRTFIMGDPLKKTLVMTHGYFLASVYYFPILAKLKEHFRLVLFDNLSFGANTRLHSSSA
jgi:pimeloyl-ACP methyl ester carboxylesterase